MTSQVFNPFEVEPTQPFMLRDILPGPAWAPFQAAPQCPIAGVQSLSQPAAQGGPRKKYRLLTMMTAVCLEIAIPLGVFGIWEFWSHLHY